MTAGPAAGNKIRKLEYLLADAIARGAGTVITCGGFQSNHCRATAILARQLGMKPVLLLRTASQPAPAPVLGNAFLDWMVGAEIRPIRPEQYRDRMALMAALSGERERAGERVYVIPEGGSNGLGALGYVDAMREVREQLDAAKGALPDRFDAIVHACGSGGTAAGVALGCALFEVAEEVISMAVCDDRSYFEGAIDAIVRDAGVLLEAPTRHAGLRVVDAYKGPAYAVASPAQRAFILEVARCCGLVLDPVYTGKALFGLARLARKPTCVLFLHTGGLPGLLAQARDFGS